jgi:DNA polymerase
MIVHLDYETRSAVDLKKVGAHRYAIDPSTEILMAGVSDDQSDSPVYLWVNPRYETADMLSDPRAEALLAKATTIYAHSAPFEQAITWGVASRSPKIYAPFHAEPDINSWCCTAAMARRAGLPSSLEKCAEALSLPVQKDTRGKKLIKLFSEPQKDGKFADPKDHPDEWLAFGEYCKTDVRVEKAIHARLRAFELTGALLEAFQFDMRLNQRGIPVNVVALRNAQKIIEEVEAKVAREFVALTGLQPTQREKVRELVELPDMQAETVEAAIVEGPSRLADMEAKGWNTSQLKPIREAYFVERRRIEVLGLYQKLSYAAVKKVRTMLDCVCPDGRVRGCHVFYGAGTGRWSGKLIQPQNFKKPEKEMRELVDAAYQAICDGADADTIDLLYGDPFQVIASLIRQFIQLLGSEILDGDYNAIEGRIACWIAGEKEVLEKWRNGVDLYVEAAAFVKDKPKSEVSKGERDFGKVVELASQFGLGTEGFIRTCENWGIACTPELAERAIHEYYRPSHPMIVKRWWLMDSWMREAIAQPGVQCGPMLVRTIAGIKYLLLKLPSGRSLAFPHIEINKREPTDKEKKAMAEGKKFPETRFLEISYWGNIKGNLWGRIKLYSSLAFQNEVQGIAADLMAHGAISCEKLSIFIFALIHDQGLAVRDNGQTAEEYSAALATLPSWAKGLPLKAESKVAEYYKK